MRTYGLFSEKQYGLIPGRSTVLQLIEVMDEWTEIIDDVYVVDEMHCDFMKAFDTVAHIRLFK